MVLPSSILWLWPRQQFYLILFWLSMAQQDWAYEFPDRTGPDTQICGTLPAAPDWIRTYIFNFLQNKYWLSILILSSPWSHIWCQNLNWDGFDNRQNNLEKKVNLNLNFLFLIFFSTLKSVKSSASGKENVWFPDSPGFENLLDFRDRTWCPVEIYNYLMLIPQFYIQLV